MLAQILSYIRSTADSQLEQILSAALDRKRVLFPDWDIQYIAVPKNDPREQEILLEFISKWTQKDNKPG